MNFSQRPVNLYLLFKKNEYNLFKNCKLSTVSVLRSFNTHNFSSFFFIVLGLYPDSCLPLLPCMDSFTANNVTKHKGYILLGPKLLKT